MDRRGDHGGHTGPDAGGGPDEPRHLPRPGSDAALDVDRLRAVGERAGLDAVGVAPADVLEPARSVLGRRQAAGLAATMQFTYRNPVRSTDPSAAVAGARSMVVGLLRYRPDQPPLPGPGRGRVARYVHGDAYGGLREALQAMAVELRRSGHEARVVADSNALVDRNAAWRAGLGWYGKNTNLLNGAMGSWFVIGAVITDADLPPAPGPLLDGCGPCTACLDGCPTAALVAPGVLDARRCIAWLVQAAEAIPVELRAAVGDRLYGCDLCQEVCPPNRAPAADSAGADHPTTAWVDVVELLSLDDATVLERYGRWYIAGRDPDVIRRTALVVLGNDAGLDPSTVVPVLARYLSDPNPLLRAHATWAARRHRREDLAAVVADDPVAEVRAELRGHVEPVRGPEAPGAEATSGAGRR